MSLHDNKVFPKLSTHRHSTYWQSFGFLRWFIAIVIHHVSYSDISPFPSRTFSRQDNVEEFIIDPRPPALLLSPSRHTQDFCVRAWSPGEFPEPLWTANRRLMRSGRIDCRWNRRFSTPLNATPRWGVRHREHGIVADLHQGDCMMKRQDLLNGGVQCCRQSYTDALISSPQEL